MAGIVLIAFLLAAKMTAAMQQWIAEPVLMLAKTARQVGERNDYSVRSPLDGRGDELGALARAFNHMLSRIHAQDVALNLSQKKLEALVNSLDGIVWEWNPRQGRFTYVSRQCEQILGHPPEKWLADPNFWAAIVHPDDLAASMAARREATERLQAYSGEYRAIAADGRVVWIRESSVGLAEDGEPAICRGILRDITAQKNAADVLKKLNSQLVEASRKAGMAEVATGVLHNVGNVLNSVNVSATLLLDSAKRSNVSYLGKAVALLNEHIADLAPFLANDPKGRQLPGYLTRVSEELGKEQQRAITELESLRQNIEHIKEIVAMQQNYANVSGVVETVKVTDLVEDALRMNAGALARHEIALAREFSEVPMITVDKHKVLQVLVNVIRNAKYACDESGRKDKQIRINVSRRDQWVCVAVTDNGVGIPEENKTRIFNHGFTTRKDGHGFGLHSGALATSELGGTLTAHSDGVGQGATFTLELPLEPPDAAS
jgi:PAS domain S-box-containing protein